MQVIEDIPPRDPTALPPRLVHTSSPGTYKSSLPPSLLRWSVFTIDISIACLIAVFTLYTYHATILDVSLRTALPYMLFPVAAMLGLSFFGTYGLSFSRTINQHVVRALNGAGAGLMLLAIIIWSLSSAPGKYILPLGLIWASIGGIHLAYVILMKRLFLAGHLSEKVIIIGATQQAESLISQNRFSRELNILGVFDDRASRTPNAIENIPVLGGMNELMAWDRLPEVDRIIVTISSDARDRIAHLISQLRVLPNRIVLMLDLESFQPEETEMVNIGAKPAAYVSGSSTDMKRVFVKRLTDIVFGFGLLAAFSPIMLIAALLIKLEDGGPIFFRQLRHGFNNELIRVWKFRSMRPDKEAADNIKQQTLKNDPRVTRIGRFIRKTSIDELPQLFNVLAGNMSLVGSRPHAVGMTAESTIVHEIVAEYAHRHRAKPGLTGWAQINSSRGPVHTHAEVRERVRLDMEYLKRSSFFFDLYIMIMTAPCLLGDAKKER